jgi:hypothetical protein
MPDRSMALLYGRRGSLAAELLDIGRDMQRLHGRNRRPASGNKRTRRQIFVGRQAATQYRN